MVLRLLSTISNQPLLMHLVSSGFSAALATVRATWHAELSTCEGNACTSDVMHVAKEPQLRDGFATAAVLG